MTVMIQMQFLLLLIYYFERYNLISCNQLQPFSTDCEIAIPQWNKYNLFDSVRMKPVDRISNDDNAAPNCINSPAVPSTNMFRLAVDLEQMPQ